MICKPLSYMMHETLSFTKELDRELLTPSVWQIMTCSEMLLKVLINKAKVEREKGMIDTTKVTVIDSLIEIKKEELAVIYNYINEQN